MDTNQNSSFSQSSSLVEKPKRKSCWVWGSVFGCIFLLLIFVGGPIALIAIIGGLSGYESGDVTEKIIQGAAKDKIAIINIKGVIEPESASATTGLTAESVHEMIVQAKNDSDVKALIIDINSPGGGMVASDKIYRDLINFPKPIIALYSGELAASGGLYISMAADYIISHPDTLTGSIGVITEAYDVSELLNKYGIKVNTIKSGKYKDIGTYSRSMTEEETKMLQEIIDESYQVFVNIVAKSRKLSVDKIKEFADGRVFTGRKAKNLKLVDELGNMDSAITKAKKLANLFDAQVVEYEPPFSFSSLLNLFSSKFSGPRDALDVLNWQKTSSNYGVYYLMK